MCVAFVQGSRLYTSVMQCIRIHYVTYIHIRSTTMQNPLQLHIHRFYLTTTGSAGFLIVVLCALCIRKVCRRCRRCRKCKWCSCMLKESEGKGSEGLEDSNCQGRDCKGTEGSQGKKGCRCGFFYRWRRKRATTHTYVQDVCL